MENKKILIIEDEEEIRECIRILLGNDGFTFIEAENGIEGLALLKEDIDLVILDIIDRLENRRRRLSHQTVFIFRTQGKDQSVIKKIL